MKRYAITWITATALTIFAACGSKESGGEMDTDTTMTTLPAEAATHREVTSGPNHTDTAAIPPIDPGLDTAARKGNMPPK